MNKLADVFMSEKTAYALVIINVAVLLWMIFGVIGCCRVRPEEGNGH